MMKCSSGLCSYWHTRASSSGAPARPGKRYPRYARAARSPSAVACRSPAVGSNGGPRVSSATLKPRHRLPGMPYMKRAPWSAQTGIASSVNRVSPGGVPILDGELGLLEHRQRRALVLIVLLHEPQHADRVVELALPAPLVLAPQRERARRQDGVDAPRSVRPPDHARLAAGARARIAGAPGVEQRDARAPPSEMPGRPPAERARPHHHHVHSLSHRSGPPEPRTHAGGKSVS